MARRAQRAGRDSEIGHLNSAVTDVPHVHVDIYRVEIEIGKLPVRPLRLSVSDGLPGGQTESDVVSECKTSIDDLPVRPF